MLRKLRPRSAYDVVALIALFVAVSTGGAYAANTVFSTDIVDGEVKTPDLATDAVTQPKLRDGAVGRPELANGVVSREKINNGAVDSSKVADNSLTGADIVESSLGTVPAAYEADHAILSDSAHSAGHAPVEGYVTRSDTASSGSQVEDVLQKTVDCPPGKRPLGGGGYGHNSSFTDGDNVAIINSEPAVYIHPGTGDVYPYGWYVKVKNNTPNTALDMGVEVVCANTDLAGP
jgi:hypothetical protein